MRIFLPFYHDALLLFLALLVIEFFTGFLWVRFQLSKVLAWAFPVIFVTCIHFGLETEKEGFRMLALILVLLVGMKIVTASYLKNKFTMLQWFLYCFAWVGMNPKIFFEKRGAVNNKLFYQGMFFIFSGVVLMTLLSLLIKSEIPTGIGYYFYSLILLVGLSQILHFGFLNINAFILQLSGYPSYSLFKAPLKSQSLKEFWGTRWNMAFIEMTSIVIYRPLVKKISIPAAMFLTFLLSGLLHEVALSLPVKAGYGLPTLYFMIHGILVAAESKLFKKKKPGRMWVIVSLLMPLPLLFHDHVMTKVFWKLLL